MDPGPETIELPDTQSFVAPGLLKEITFFYLFFFLPTDGLITSSHDRFIQLTNNNKVGGL